MLPLLRPLTVSRIKSAPLHAYKGHYKLAPAGISGITCHPLSSSHPDLWNSIPSMCHVLCLDRSCSYFQTQLKFYLLLLEVFPCPVIPTERVIYLP